MEKKKKQVTAKATVVNPAKTPAKKTPTPVVKKKQVHKFKKKPNGKNDVGAPTKYKPEYCKQIIQWMGKGKSIESFAGKIGVSMDTPYEWAKNHKEFSESIKIGKAKSYYYWENIAQGVTLGNIPMLEKASVPMLIFQLKNRLKWKDRVDVYEKDKLDEALERDVEEAGGATDTDSMRAIVAKYGKALEVIDNIKNQ